MSTNQNKSAGPATPAVPLPRSEGGIGAGTVIPMTGARPFPNAPRIHPLFSTPIITLDVPDDWRAVGNGAETTRPGPKGRASIAFQETEPLPTYLFAFAAGRFSVESAQRDGRTIRMFHRETDASKLALLHLVEVLRAKGCTWIDIQMMTPHMEALGARELPRDEFQIGRAHV